MNEASVHRVRALNHAVASMTVAQPVKSLLIEQLWTTLAGISPDVSMALARILSEVGPEAQAEVVGQVLSALGPDGPLNDNLEAALQTSDGWGSLTETAQGFVLSTGLPPIVERLTAVVEEYAQAKDDDMNQPTDTETFGETATMWRTDVGLLTPLPEETHEVVTWLRSAPDYDHKRDLSGRYHYFGTVRLEGSLSLRVAVVQPFKPGQLSMGRALESLSTNHRPRLTILMGIGGGVSTKPIGDVVVATGVTNYDPSADTEGGTQREMDPYSIGPKTRGFLNDFFQEYGPSVPLREDGDTTYYLTMGPIGSGSVVVKTADSEITQALKAANRKTDIVETEAAAVAAAFFEDRDANEHFLVVRGISDKADRDKNDADHKLACENAVLGVKKLIEHIWPDLSDA